MESKLRQVPSPRVAFSQFRGSQPQGAADNRDGTQAHRSTRNDRAEKQAEETFIGFFSSTRRRR